MGEMRHLNKTEVLDRLLKEYHEHKSLFIAFDFDNTVFDYHKTGDDYSAIINRLKQAKEQGHKLILFSAREGRELEEAFDYCDSIGLTPDYVNENPEVNPGCRKPYYNILIDDRAGLPCAFEVLTFLLNNIEASRI